MIVMLTVDEAGRLDASLFARTGERPPAERWLRDQVRPGARFQAERGGGIMAVAIAQRDGGKRYAG